MTSPEDRAPDYPPRIIEIYVTPGEDLHTVGEDAFVDYELEAIYSALLMRESNTHCEGCACEEEAEQEGGNSV